MTGTSRRAKTLRRQRAGPVPSCVSEAGMDGGLALVGCEEGAQPGFNPVAVGSGWRVVSRAATWPGPLGLCGGWRMEDGPGRRAGTRSGVRLVPRWRVVGLEPGGVGQEKQSFRACVLQPGERVCGKRRQVLAK